MDLLFTDFFFDHESLVYLKAFNDRIGGDPKVNDYKPVYTATGNSARTMLTLYGYYYQMERNEYC